MISKIEQNSRTGTLATLSLVADALEVPIADLLNAEARPAGGSTSSEFKASGSATEMSRAGSARNPRVPNKVLRRIREEERKETRQEFVDAMMAVAARMGVRVSPSVRYVARLEDGDIRYPHPSYRRVLAELCERPFTHLGFARPQRMEVTEFASAEIADERQSAPAMIADDERGNAPQLKGLRQAILGLQPESEAEKEAPTLPQLKVGISLADFWDHSEAARGRVALTIASPAGDDERMLPWTIFRRAQQAAAIPDAAQAIGLAQAARRNEEKLATPTRAAIRVQEAYGHALDGNDQAAQRLLDEAHTWAAVDIFGDAREGHGSYCTPDHIEVQRATCWLAAGQPKKAIALYEDSLRALPTVYHRNRAVALTRLAVAYAADSQPEQAANSAHAALPVARSAGSSRIVDEIKNVGAELIPYRALPIVAALLDELEAGESLSSSEPFKEESSMRAETLP